MTPLVCYLPSYNDSQLVAQSLASSPDWRVVICDNASDEPHRAALAALAGPNVEVVRHERSLGRVGNWRFCVEHFLAGQATWMKWLMAGDRHKPSSRAIYQRAIDQFPEARLIIANLEVVWPHERHPWSLATTAMWLPAVDALSEVALRGNVFHGLTTALVHRQLLAGGFSFGEPALSYSADLLLLLELARRTSTLFYPELAAEFVVAQRQHFQAAQYSLEHILEEGLLRLRAADHYLAMTGDARAHRQLVTEVVAWVGAGLSQPLEKLVGAAYQKLHSPVAKT